jgi:hypothetical protein
MIKSSSAFLLAGLLLAFAGAALSQPETMATGRVAGIRVEGQLFEINSSMCVVRPDWSGNLRGGGQASFAREGKVVTVKMQPATPRPAPPGAPAAAPVRQPPDSRIRTNTCAPRLPACASRRRAGNWK